MGTNSISVSGKWEREGGYWRQLHEMDVADLAALREGCSRVAFITPVVVTSSPLVFGNNSHSGRIEGGSEEHLKINNIAIERGTMFDSADVMSFAKVCVIGQTVAEHLFTDGEDPIGQTVRCGNVPVTVIGVLQHREKKFGYEPRPYNTHPYPYPAPGASAELVWTRGDAQIRVVYEIFDGMPAMRKSLYVKNEGERTFTVDRAETEFLRLNGDGRLRFYLESDYTGSTERALQTRPPSFTMGTRCRLTSTWVRTRTWSRGRPSGACRSTSCSVRASASTTG